MCRGDFDANIADCGLSFSGSWECTSLDAFLFSQVMTKKTSSIHGNASNMEERNKERVRANVPLLHT